jgi:hypothetical protein
MESGLENDLVEIRGLIIPMEWDARGKPIAVAISGFDEKTYVIEKGAIRQELLKLLKKEIKAMVRIQEACNQNVFIRIESYELVNGT